MAKTEKIDPLDPENIRALLIHLGVCEWKVGFGDQWGKWEVSARHIKTIQQFIRGENWGDL